MPEVTEVDGRLKLLLDYTKFHIGMYATLTTVGLANLDSFEASGWLSLWPTIGCLLIAGAAGGLIGSAIPYHTSFDGFRDSKLGPWRLEWIKATNCMHVEHTAFWLGIALAVLSFALGDTGGAQ